MNYHRPELGERLAADYALGLMPARARRRFERALAGDATLSACVAAWSDRLAPLDAIADEVTPPARVWHAIERRIAVLAPPAVKVRRPSGALVLWRYFGAAAASACAALALYIAIGPGPLPKAITQFADTGGIASWINSGKHSPSDVAISSIQPGTSERERPRWIRGTLLLTPDGAPPITIEPPAPR